MELEGAGVKMRCYYAPDRDRRKSLGWVSSYLNAIDEPLYNRFSFYESELLVFDELGGYRYLDISLEWIPAGMPLKEAVRASMEEGGNKLPEYQDALIEFALRHNKRMFCHGTLTAGDIFIDGPGNIKVTGSRNARKGDPGIDVVNLIMIISTLILTCADSRALGLLTESLHGGKLMLAGPLADIGRLPAGVGIPEEVKNAIRTAQEYDMSAVESGEEDKLAEILMSLKGARAGQNAAFSEMLDAACLDRAPAAVAGKKTRKLKYEFVGELSDMLMRMYDGKMWCYLDRNARVAIPGPFTDAHDFYEGFAVVENGEERWGLIDRHGKYVIEPEYHNIEMDHEANRLILTRDGMSGLATRLGEPVTPLCYDQILSSKEGIFMVKNGDRYGFITRDGRTVADTVFEQADNFKEGRAEVVLRGRKYLLGTDGNLIDEVLEK